MFERLRRSWALAKRIHPLFVCDKSHVLESPIVIEYRVDDFTGHRGYYLTAEARDKLTSIGYELRRLAKES